MAQTKKVKSYYAYVLECADGSFYGGFTTDVQKRVATHNAGKGAKYTKARRPVRLLYYETFQTKSQALKAEASFKKLTRSKKEKFLKAHQIDF
ncbi:hypothetical protein FC83_GL002237 [Agrilactobacillus composti DSM 18527 = JCM 14202]|uniref:GIY-YIG domain-containing protein n=1 Tax=Agrilactobacillus composti DSM 18527 = JCM 14202 TaxID=1423734 RepID=X0QRH2_9LACO|nr:GIY-YIG nuclease family protein [Agrilactobacillus composti]KRM36833.1 hypothetical protein FC83_GL002237 [Agrilactobacillus composti DSM 18527 = JCM 14202]GAF41225.1 putative endonuclease containing a URI domain [Agrilactobacillus composti DSM 18527 = JCM 14202]